MDDYETNLVLIRNEQHKKFLEKMALFNIYGLDSKKTSVTNDELLKFLRNFCLCKKKLLNYMVEHGLELDDKILEVTPSSLLSFQELNNTKNSKCIVKYNNTLQQKQGYLTGIMDSNNVIIQDNCSFIINEYNTIINNSVIDFFRKFDIEQHSISVAENNYLDFYSGYCINKNNPLRKGILFNFIKSIDKTKVPYDAVVMEEKDDYVYGLVKRNKEI